MAMKPTKLNRYALPAIVLVGVAAGTMLTSAASQKFYDDDPVWIERDTQDASGMQLHDVELLVDLTYNIIKGDGVAEPGRAGNVNTVDEVPDSSWFTNRLGARAMSPEAVAIGPDTTPGPAAGPWTVTSSKSDGVTPGFTIRDTAGDRWFLKFDPPGLRGMATGTEVAVTKLMWALGYNVPENHIAYLRREQLAIGEGATFTPPAGGRRAMRPGDIDTLLERASREPDGSFRVVASRALTGAPVGRVRFHDTRPDDPNDVVPHQHRRELRGYRVFAAWLNHVDAKAINSLDTLVTEGGRSFVRHHLIDFGSALGSGGVAPADYWAGEEYLVEPRQTARALLGFGFYLPKWQAAEFYEAPAIGRMPRDHRGWNPDAWKPRVPNQAFLHARADDKFWAARKLVEMSTGMIAAAVAAGDFGDPEAEAFLVRALTERRDAIARAYLPAVNPIEAPALDEAGTLTFRNAAVEYGAAAAPGGYRAVWARFDNVTSATERIGESTSPTTRLAAPGRLPQADGTFLKVELSALDDAPEPSWATPVAAYFRSRAGCWELVGFERLPQ
jgi:hypothetical protein